MHISICRETYIYIDITRDSLALGYIANERNKNNLSIKFNNVLFDINVLTCIVSMFNETSLFSVAKRQHISKM